ncbi:MAG: hypothetical protein Q7R31_04930 [Candidatus Levybacteria bacterium]|nr:hypothetical protein [Candidatus Levybacteria bacterium]
MDNENTQTLNTTETPVMNNMEQKESSVFSTKLIIILLVVAVLGIGTGYLISKKGVANVGGGTANLTKESTAGSIVGSNDTKTFKDVAEGVLKGGGINGEGAYHLVRPGGDSQNVYLTSSIVDLSLVVGKKVKIWGQTQTARYAGWLMDVGRVEILQ